MNQPDAYAFLIKRYGRPAVAVGSAIYHLRRLPGTILVCGFVVGGIAWIEVRNRIDEFTKSIKETLYGPQRW